MHMPEELTPAVLHKAIGRYYKELQDYERQAGHELALRPAFQHLLAEMARKINLTLVHEMTIRGRIRPDGVLCNDYNIRLGYWEAKGPKSNLEDEIHAKIRAGYPLDNALFENTRLAVLFQAGRRYDFDLKVMADVSAMLKKFLTYQQPDVANFEQAVLDFKEQIPHIATRLLTLINDEYTSNRAFLTAFTAFTTLCQSTLNPQISADEIKEMLVQHLLTERLFRTVFDNPDFVHKNAIAVEIERVIQALTSRSFNRREFLRALDPFYHAIENAARGLETWSERQHFLNTVYERFFQGFAIKKADTHGIVYTPQEIVDFMVSSVDEVLQREFGKALATPGVKILDPATGTGNFIVNIVKRIPRGALTEKYTRDLFCNEIMLLPYYIAALNIEHEYYDKMGTYLPFEGVCFADTLELAEGQQLTLFAEENTERVQREKDADIMVVIGNPPYNAWQKSENDNNKNRKYTLVDQRIRGTYVKDSKATLNNSSYDPYVKFFRWAADRLQGRDGIVCYVSNNSFINQIAFDGMRKNLLQDFTYLYHIDLHGNVRKNPKLSGSTHNVFGIQVGVGVTIAVRTSQPAKRAIYYHRVPEFWTKAEKLAFLANAQSAHNINWQELYPDDRYTWLTEGLQVEFDSHDFLPLGTKDAKGSHLISDTTIFKLYSRGVTTSRDEWVYDFNAQRLAEKMKTFAQNYNSEVFRLGQEKTSPTFPRSKEAQKTYIDSFVNNTPTFLKWTDRLKETLLKGQTLQYDPSQIRHALYRPFCKQSLYFDTLLNHRRYQQHHIFPTPTSEVENLVIVMSDHGHRSLFSALATNHIPDLHLLASTDAFQCFPYYTYAEDGSKRRENITDWALARFQERYGAHVSKWDIFHYVYAMLHHPQYRERYAENLKRDLPHLPLLNRSEAYQAAVRIGRELMQIHVNYEQAAEYGLRELEDESVPYLLARHVEKMRLTPDKTALVVNKGLTLTGLPDACWRYRLGNRAALEWVIDQYQVSTDARSGIRSDPNCIDDPGYIVRLIKQVVTVSVQTVALVDELAQVVTQEDWLP